MVNAEQQADFKWLVAGTVLSALQLLYIVSPIDFIPDFIPFIGWADDLLGLVAAATVTSYGVWRLARHPGLPNTVKMPSMAPSGARPLPAGGAADYEPMNDDEIRSW